MKRIFAAGLAIALVASAPCFAEETETSTVTTTSSSVKTSTVLEPAKLEGDTRAIHFEDYDLDHDGKLTREEAGEMLFRLYDTDGNQVIDDVEYKREAVLSASPMTKTTRTVYDHDNDGVADKEEVSEEKMTIDTMLTRFDKNGNGLSPEEFTGQSFRKVDVNRSNVIEKKEWQGVYDGRIDAKNRAEAALNK